MHKCLVRFPAVASFIEFELSEIKLQGGSTIAVDSQRISADHIVDERAKIISNPLS